MNKLLRIVGCACLITLLLSACKSSRTVVTTPIPQQVRYLTSKLQVTIPGGGGSLTAGGTMKLKEGERVQISVLMPLIRTEIARLEITPHEVLLIDRMNKRYVRASREELKDVLPEEANYGTLEKLLFAAALPNGRKELNGKELGIPLLENTRVKLYDFATDPVAMTPTNVSDVYTPVPLPVLLKMLSDL
ncbi:MAG: DUF4292 domain-containing protein [Bacteroides sp.]